MNRKVALVTGATGFVGRPLCQLLQREGWRVLALARTVGPGPWEVALRHDLGRERTLVVPERIDAVFHLGGKAHALAERKGEEESYRRINFEGTQTVLAAAAEAGALAFVYFSSVKAVEESGRNDRPMDESWAAPASTAYGRSKREAEDAVLASRTIPHGVVLRPCLVYGPRPKGNLERMIRAVAKGRFPPLPEVGNRRSMVHVDDLIRAAVLSATAAKARGETFIVADEHPFSTRELLDWIREALGRPKSGAGVPLWLLRGLARGGDAVGTVLRRRPPFDSDALGKLMGSAWYSSLKLQRCLDWHPERTLHDALPEIVASLLSLPTTDRSAPSDGSPDRVSSKSS